MRKADPKEYATLFLARSIIEGNAEGTKAALDAGADLAAFWIDGRTTLAKLAAERGPAKLAELVASMGPLPKFSDGQRGRDIWTRDFILFAAMRGFEFTRRTTPREGAFGTDLPDFGSAKAAVQFIERTRHGVDDASCEGTRWRINFGAEWRRDKRIVGFVIEFWTSVDGPEMLRMFSQARGSRTESDWPPEDAPEIQQQRDWESDVLAYGLLSEYACPSFKTALSLLRRGASPFAEFKSFRGPIEPLAHYDDEQALKLMRAIRAQVEPGRGWRERLKPYLTDAGVRSLMQKAELEEAIGQGAPEGQRSANIDRAL